MNRKDSIILKMISIRPSLNKNFLPILERLELKYPQNYEIQIQFIRLLCECEMYEEAICRLNLVCIKYQKYDDFAKLIVLLFFEDSLDDWFGIKYVEKIKNVKDRETFLQIIDLMKNKECRLHCEELIESKYSIDLNNSNLICDTFSELNSSQANTSINEYKFHDEYVKIILLIKNNHFADALKLSFKIFNVSTYHSAIQSMIDHEKIELLFYFSKYNLFFKKYYDQALRKIQKGLIKILESCILIRSLKFVKEFMGIMKDRDSKITVSKYSLDDQNLRDLKYATDKKSVFI